MATKNLAELPAVNNYKNFSNEIAKTLIASAKEKGVFPWETPPLAGKPQIIEAYQSKKTNSPGGRYLSRGDKNTPVTELNLAYLQSISNVKGYQDSRWIDAESLKKINAAIKENEKGVTLLVTDFYDKVFNKETGKSSFVPHERKPGETYPRRYVTMYNAEQVSNLPEINLRPAAASKPIAPERKEALEAISCDQKTRNAFFKQAINDTITNDKFNLISYARRLVTSDFISMMLSERYGITQPEPDRKNFQMKLEYLEKSPAQLLQAMQYADRTVRHILKNPELEQESAQKLEAPVQDQKVERGLEAPAQEAYERGQQEEEQDLGRGM